METINRFVKGIVSDLNPIDVSSQNWVFPTLNMRITQQGDMVVAKPITGNDEFFELPEGYDIIGAKEYANILYLVLFKSENNYVGLYSYPSVGMGGDSFNYELGIIPFLLGGTGPENKLKYDGRKVDLLFTSSYDGTVDIYLNDRLNPTYVINNCFNSKGEFIDRRVDYSGLPNNIRLINDYVSPAVFGEIFTEPGGRLEPGSYQLFLKYVSESFDESGYISQSDIFTVYTGEFGLLTLGNHLAKYYSVDGEKEYVNKKIKFELKDLDPNYRFFQIAVVVNTGNAGEESTALAYLISTLFETSSNNNIIIDGREKRETLSLNDISVISQIDNINKSQAIINNRYIGANWINSGFNNAEFSLIAKSITVEEGLTISSEGTYFPNEIYPFGVVFRLNDGRETDVYPITGKNLETGEDMPYGLVYLGFENKDENGEILHHPGVSYTVVFKYNDIVEKLKDYPDIIGFYIVRGERIPNIISSGIVFPTSDKVAASNVHF